MLTNQFFFAYIEYFVGKARRFEIRLSSAKTSTIYLLERMESITNYCYEGLDRGLIPDFITRRAIRYLCNQRLQEISLTNKTESVQSKWQYIKDLKENEVAIETAKANEQHYEVGLFTHFKEFCEGRYRFRDSSIIIMFFKSNILLTIPIYFPIGLNRIHSILFRSQYEIFLLFISNW